MPNPEIIRRRMVALDGYLAVLKGLQRFSREAFLVDPERYGSAERFLQLAIEALNDIGNHVVADLGLGTVESYADIPEILSTRGYVDLELAHVWMRMIGFRNVLVHDYLDVDRGIVFDVLHGRLIDFERIRDAFAQFL